MSMLFGSFNQFYDEILMHKEQFSDGNRLLLCFFFQMALPIGFNANADSSNVHFIVLHFNVLNGMT